MGRDRVRTVVYVMGGLYLDYLAYGLWKDYETMEENKILIGFFIVLFAVVGTGFAIFGLWKAYQLSKLQKTEQADAEGSDKNSRKSEESEAVDLKTEESEAVESEVSETDSKDRIHN